MDCGSQQTDAVQRCPFAFLLSSAERPLLIMFPWQGVCTTHSMDGCQECTSVGNMNFKSCPEVFNIYGRLCVCE